VVTGSSPYEGVVTGSLPYDCVVTGSPSYDRVVTGSPPYDCVLDLHQYVAETVLVGNIVYTAWGYIIKFFNGILLVFHYI